MMKHTRSLFMGFVLSAGMLTLAPSTFAAPDISHDFTNEDWIGVIGQTDVTINGLRFVSEIYSGAGEFVETGAGLTWNAGGGTDPNTGLVPCLPTGLDYACQGDGIGIGDDEVSYLGEDQREVLTIYFTGGPVAISEVSFLDLFIEGRTLYTESAYVFINGDVTANMIFDATAGTGTNGFYRASGSPISGISSISFGAACDMEGGPEDCKKVDYSLAGINVVPIPAAAWLFGSGLIGLAGIARRRKAG